MPLPLWMRNTGFQLSGTQNWSELFGSLELLLGPAELGAPRYNNTNTNER